MHLKQIAGLLWVLGVALICLGCDSRSPKLNAKDFEECQDWFLFRDCIEMEPEVFVAFQRIDRHCRYYEEMLTSPHDYDEADFFEAEIEVGSKLDPLKAATCRKVTAENLRCMWTGVYDGGTKLRGKYYVSNPGGTCGIGYRHNFLANLGFNLPTNEEVGELLRQGWKRPLPLGNQAPWKQ